MTTLAQALARRDAVNKSTHETLTARWKALQRKELSKGIVKTYDPQADELEKPAESKKVQLNVLASLTQMGGPLKELIDTTAARDFANTYATADVILGDETIIEDAPTHFLIWLKGELDNAVAEMKVLPIYDTAQDWEPAGEPGLWQTASVRKAQTENRQHFEVPRGAEGNEHHAAQVVQTTRPHLVGYWTERQLSGALTPAQRHALITRAEELRAAVVDAIQRANHTEIRPLPDIGQAVVDSLLAPVLG